MNRCNMQHEFNNDQAAKIPNKPVFDLARTRADFHRQHGTAFCVQHEGQAGHGADFRATSATQHQVQAIPQSWIAPWQQSYPNHTNSFFSYSGPQGYYALRAAAQFPTGVGPYHWSGRERCFLPGRGDFNRVQAACSATATATTSTVREVQQRRPQQYDSPLHYPHWLEAEVQRHRAPASITALMGYRNIDDESTLDDGAPEPNMQMLHSNTPSGAAAPPIEPHQSTEIPSVCPLTGGKSVCPVGLHSDDKPPDSPPQPNHANTVRTIPDSSSRVKKNMVKKPSPSSTYLNRAEVIRGPVSSPHRLLVILDLNGTLLFRRNRGGSNFTRRPQLDQFLEYLFHNHSVMVWSSARQENVQAMCERLFKPTQLSEIVAIWAREHLRLKPQAFHNHVQVYKQLSWVWGDKRIASKRRQSSDTPWSQMDTVLIDDSVEKAASEPYNVVAIDAFKPASSSSSLHTDADVLGAVAAYLDDLKMHGNVSAYMRQTPFVFDRDREVDWERLLERR